VTETLHKAEVSQTLQDAFFKINLFLEAFILELLALL
jgi:hypothetical protein